MGRLSGLRQACNGKKVLASLGSVCDGEDSLLLPNFFGSAGLSWWGGGGAEGWASSGSACGSKRLPLKLGKVVKLERRRRLRLGRDVYYKTEGPVAIGRCRPRKLMTLKSYYPRYNFESRVLACGWPISSISTMEVLCWPCRFSVCVLNLLAWSAKDKAMAKKYDQVGV